MISKLGKIINKYYWWVLLVGLIFTIICVWGISRLTLRTQMSDILPQKEPSVQLYNYATKNFSGIDTFLIGIEGKREDIINFIDAVDNEIAKVRGVDRVVAQTEVKFAEKNGLLILDKPSDLMNMQGMLTATNLKDFVKGLNDNLESTYTSSGDSDKLSKDKNQMLMFINTIRQFASQFSAKDIEIETIKENSSEFIRGPKYYIAPDNDLGIILVRTSVNLADMENVMYMVNTIEDLVEKEAPNFNVKATLGGNHVIQRDEMEYGEADMSMTSILSLILIMLIFYIGFRAIRYSLLSAVPLIIGIIWCLGITSFVIGSLNLFTALVGAILIGLGIDYSIHVISIYTEKRSEGLGVEESVQMVFEKVVRGIITGAVTTALGFLLFTISSFTAFKEFGFVLGLGIVTTFLASITILPALLRVFPFKPGKKRKEIIGQDISLVEKVLLKKPLWVVVGVVIILIISIAGMPRVYFSRNIEDIEPKGLPSLAINKKVQDKFDFGADSTIFVSQSIEDAYKLKNKLEDLSTVGMVESIASYIPTHEKQLQMMKAAKTIKANIRIYVDPQIYDKSLKIELLRLQDNMIELSDLAYIGGEKRLANKLDNLVNSKVIVNAAENVDANQANIKKYQKIFISNLEKKVMQTNTSQIITINDLPKSIADNYIGKDGKYLTTAYPTGDPWEGEFQDIHFAQIHSLEEVGTGFVEMGLKVMNIAGEEGRIVLFLTVIFMYLVLLIDFRSFKYATMAMLPMGLTLSFMLGIMGWFNIPFNYVNIIALPLIIGIGVDDGVHLIHRYLIENDIFIALKSTGRAITFTTLTTAAAFGTMIIAKYQGYSSFAQLLIMGVVLAYLITLLLIPALLVMMKGRES